MPTVPIATLPIESFVYLVSVLLDLEMSVNCSYHVITSSLLWVFIVSFYGAWLHCRVEAWVRGYRLD